MSRNVELLRKGSILKRLRFLFKDTLLYGSAGAVSKSVQVFLIPVLARVFAQEEYGVIDAISVVGTLILPFMVMGLDSATARYYYENDDIEYKKQIMTNALLVQLSLAIVLSTFLFIFSKEILSFYLGTDQYSYELKILALSQPFVIIVKFAINLLKWTFQRFWFMVISLGPPLFTVLLTIILVTNHGAHIHYVFLSQLFVQIVFSVFSVFILRKHITYNIDFAFLKPLIKYGFPLMLTTVIFALIPAIDRYSIGKHLGLADIGVYAIAMKTAALSQLAVYGFQTAWGPMAFSIHKEKDAEQTYNIVFKGYVLFLLIFTFLFTIFLKDIVLLLASVKYVESTILVVPLLFGLLVQSLSGITSLGISLSKKTHFFLLANLIYLITAFTSISLLVIPYGLIGVAYAVLLSHLVHFTVVSLVSFKLKPIRFDYKGVLLLLALMLAFSVFYIHANHSNSLKTVVTVLYILIAMLVTWFLIMQKNERTKLLIILKKTF